MIAGIINSAGIKEDAPVAMNAPAGAGRGFDRILQQASGQRPGPADKSGTKEVSRSDAPARSQYGSAAKQAGAKDSASPDSAKGPDVVAPEETTAQEESAEAGQQAVVAGLPDETDAMAFAAVNAATPSQDQEGAAGSASNVLEFNEVSSKPAPAARPGAQVQIGNAAYRIATHGNTEAQYADQVGRTPQPGAAPIDPAAVLEPTPQGAVPRIHPALNGKNAEFLALAEQQGRAPLSPQQLVLQAISQGDAQTRNQLMMTYGLQQSTQLTGHGANAAAMFSAVRLPVDGPMSMPRMSAVQTGEGSATASMMTSPTLMPLENSAAPAPTAGAPVPSEQMVDRLYQEARLMIGNNRNEATFKLHPENLGEVHLKVTQQDGVFKLDMTVHSHTVKTLIESQMDDLRSRLSAEDIGNGEFLFNVDVNQGDHQPNPRAFGEAADTMPSLGTTPVTAETAAQQMPAKLRPIWGAAGTGVYA